MSDENPKATRGTQITVALIGAGAVILAAIIGLAASKGGSGGSPGVAAGTNSPSASSNTGSTSPVTPTPSSSVTLLWHHSVRFPYSTGLDLNDDQPNIVALGNSPDFSTATQANDLPGFQAWRGKSGTVAKPDPNFSECNDSFVSQAQEGLFDSRIGQSACFESQDGTRVAAVTVLSWDKQTWAMNADVTVWQATGS